MGRAAAESILHGLVAALTIVAILGAGRIRDPQSRLHFWWLALACPVLLTPGYRWLVPARLDEGFRDGWALFSGDRLAPFAWHGIDVGTAGALGLAVAGLLLYLRDLLPFLLELRRSRVRNRVPATVPELLAQAGAKAAAVLHTPVPRLRVFASPHPILSCRGLRRPLIVASTALLERLTLDELDAAITHEVAHAKHRDPALGWGLMLVRGLFCFNPAVQLCARAAAHELERRADQTAAMAVGGPEPVARSLRKLAGEQGDATRESRLPAWHGFRLAAIAERCQALLDRQPTAPAPRFILAATAIGLGVILFLTVA
jgi:Zn-dependent protease with chaperone function